MGGGGLPWTSVIKESGRQHANEWYAMKLHDCNVGRDGAQGSSLVLHSRAYLVHLVRLRWRSCMYCRRAVTMEHRPDAR